jgi:hypothetical protein
VGIADRLADLLEHGQEAAAVAGRLHALFQQVFEGSALDELHRQVRPPIVEPADFEDRWNAWVLELGRDARFVDKALAH